jgi:hypothetical protein
MSHSFELILDPACGSAGFLLDAVRLLSDPTSSYNKQSLAGLEDQTELPHSISLEAIQAAEMLAKWQMIMGTVPPPSSAICRTDNLADSPTTRVKLWDWEQTLPAFDHLLTSAPLDLITVDTLEVVFPISRVTISAHHQLQVIQADDEQKNGLLWVFKDGTFVTGEYAYFDYYGLHFEVKPLKRGWIDGDNVGAIVRFSLPGIYGHRDNSWPLNKRVAIAMIDAVRDKLADMGVTLDFRSGKITRCDLNRNVVLDEPFYHYQPMLNALDVPRTQKRDHNGTGTGIERTNNSQGVLVYDKIVRMQREGLRTNHLPPHLARVEWQIKKARNVSKRWHINTVQDLVDHWEDLPSLYLANQSQLFRYDVEALQSPQPRASLRQETPIQSKIANLLRWCDKRGLRHRLDPKRLEKMVRQGRFGDYAKTIKAVPDMDRKYANNAVAAMRVAFWREAFQDADFVRRYTEFKQKVEQGSIRYPRSV